MYYVVYYILESIFKAIYIIGFYSFGYCVEIHKTQRSRSQHPPITWRTISFLGKCKQLGPPEAIFKALVIFCFERQNKMLYTTFFSIRVERE